jgi:hypothetical protein
VNTPQPNSEPKVTFEMLKNETVDLGVPIAIPTTFREQETAHTQIIKVGNAPPRMVNLAVLPSFDFGPGSFVHSIALLNEEPRYQKRTVGVSDEMHQKLRDKAVEVAIENRTTNDLLRAKLRHYESQGTLRVLSDSFASEFEDGEAAE